MTSNFASGLRRPALAACLALAAACVASLPVAAQDAGLIEAFTKAPSFERVKLSPDGTYLALIVPMEDRAILAMIRRSDMSQVGAFSVAGRTRVLDFWWVNDERLVLSLADQQGFLDTPSPTGELYGVNVDGTGVLALVGERSHEMQTGTRLAKRDGTPLYGDFVSRLPNSDHHILIATTSLETANPTHTDIARLDVQTGTRNEQTKILVPFADVLADHLGKARFGSGVRSDGYHRLFYRPDVNADWTLVNDESVSDHREFAVGFSPDDGTAYLVVSQAQGPAALVALDIATGKRTEIVRDARVDPLLPGVEPDRHDGDPMLRALDNQTPVAVRFYDPKPRLHFLDNAPDLRLARSLAKAFAGLDFDMDTGTRDGKFALVTTSGDRNPGAAYLFDVAAKKASLLSAARGWLNPAGLAEVRAFEFTARDGTPIQGTLTLPNNVSGKPPLVVNPHGGPFGFADVWGFDEEAQLLAAHGYAVLKVNFRGSGNYGRAFQLQGHREWGRLMQDDITDATKAAIAQGIADPQRICLMGASYGAYAALMGPVREPGLYRCVAGLAGVYDLPMMYRKGDTRETRLGRNLLAYTLGDDEAELKARSPVTHAAEIKVPVFLAAGGEDQRAPIAHSKAMREALIDAGNTPEWLAYQEEGHGFYLLAHRREYYKRLLAFLGKHIGAPAPAAAP
jgi:dipeptidyl aminopeptidase/acylaminoacyl peptidase